MQATVSCWLRLTPENVKILNSKKKVLSVFTKTSVDYCGVIDAERFALITHNSKLEHRCKIIHCTTDGEAEQIVNLIAEITNFRDRGSPGKGGSRKTKGVGAQYPGTKIPVASPEKQDASTMSTSSGSSHARRPASTSPSRLPKPGGKRKIDRSPTDKRPGAAEAAKISPTRPLRDKLIGVFAFGHVHSRDHLTLAGTGDAQYTWVQNALSFTNGTMNSKRCVVAKVSPDAAANLLAPGAKDTLSPVIDKTRIATLEQLKALSHPNLSKFAGVCYDANESVYMLASWTQSKNTVSLDALLKDGRHSNAPQSAEDGLRLCRGVAYGLSYLHEQKVVHACLLPLTIYVGQTAETVKLVCYGLSEFIAYGEAVQPAYRNYFDVSAQGASTFATDIYSMGVVFLGVCALAKIPSSSGMYATATNCCSPQHSTTASGAYVSICSLLEVDDSDGEADSNSAPEARAQPGSAKPPPPFPTQSAVAVLQSKDKIVNPPYPSPVNLKLLRDSPSTVASDAQLAALQQTSLVDNVGSPLVKLRLDLASGAPGETDTDAGEPPAAPNEKGADAGAAEKDKQAAKRVTLSDVGPEQPALNALFNTSAGDLQSALTSPRLTQSEEPRGTVDDAAAAADADAADDDDFDFFAMMAEHTEETDNADAGWTLDEVPEMKQLNDTQLTGPAKWAVDFVHVLTDPDALIPFKAYLKTVKADEGLEFWQDTEKIREAPADQVAALCEKVYLRYINLATSGAKAMHFMKPVRVKLEEAYTAKKFTNDMYAAAQKEFFYKTKHDGYVGFLASGIYSEARGGKPEVEEEDVAPTPTAPGKQCVESPNGKTQTPSGTPSRYATPSSDSKNSGKKKKKWKLFSKKK